MRFFLGLIIFLLLSPLSSEGSPISKEAQLLSQKQQVKLIIQKLFPDSIQLDKALCPLTLEEFSSNSIYLYNPWSGKIASIEIQDSKEALAFSGEDKLALSGVILSSSFLSQIKSPEELAFVLAHEMAHIELGHLTSSINLAFLTNKQREHIVAVHHKWELTADTFALNLLNKQGFKTNDISSFIKRLDKTLHKHTEEKSLHPSLLARLENIASDKTL
jgi:Peptidase family M48